MDEAGPAPDGDLEIESVIHRVSIICSENPIQTDAEVMSECIWNVWAYRRNETACPLPWGFFFQFCLVLEW